MVGGGLVKIPRVRVEWVCCLSLAELLALIVGGACGSVGTCKGHTGLMSMGIAL